jgi:hypothetical protein
MARFWQLWIPRFIAKPVFKVTKESDTPLKWTGKIDHAYRTQKESLTESQALGIPQVGIHAMCQKKGNFCESLDLKIRNRTLSSGPPFKKTT